MKITHAPLGALNTNCYILNINGDEFIIDPGMDNENWIEKNISNPVAILNTHGHFDHVYFNAKLKEKYNIPIYCHKDDEFMLKADIFQFSFDFPESRADYLVNSDELVRIHGVDFRFWHFPGHSPGSCVIEVENKLFSGDFIFCGSIGRYDFPYSDANEMKKSIKKILNFSFNYEIYPGHGPSTCLDNERANLLNYLNFL